MADLRQLKDFRNFLYLVWKQLNLPEPTKYSMKSRITCSTEINEQLSKAFAASVKAGFALLMLSTSCCSIPQRTYLLSLLQKLEQMTSQLLLLGLSMRCHSLSILYPKTNNGSPRSRLTSDQHPRHTPLG